MSREFVYEMRWIAEYLGLFKSLTALPSGTLGCQRTASGQRDTVYFDTREFFTRKLRVEFVSSAEISLLHPILFVYFMVLFSVFCILYLRTAEKAK